MKLIVEFKFLGLVSIGLLLVWTDSMAQVPGLEWAKNVGGPAIVNGSSVATDASGNVYTTGSFAGTADFNPGAGTFELTSNDYDGFVSKVDADGNFVWAKHFGAGLFDAGTSITIDATGNIVVAGYFAETVNFDPGISDVELTALGGWDGVILKLTPNGDFIFAKQLGGVDDEYITAIQTDVSNNIYTTGAFNGVADFDPDDVSTFELTSSGATDVFVSKLDADGNFEWAVSFGRSVGDIGVSLAIDQSNNIYLTGQYEDIDTSSDYSIFIIKLDSDGNQLWEWELLDSTTGIATGDNTVNSIITDADGDIYLSGTFKGTVNFDPLGTGFDLTGPDAYLCKLNSSGELIWAIAFGFTGNNAWINSMALDISGNIFLTGAYNEKIDVDPGAGVANIYARHSEDQGMLVLKLDNNGNYVWGQGFDELQSSESGSFITTDNTGNIYVLGDFSGTTVLATGVCSSTELTDSSGDGSSFLLKLNPTSVPTTCFGIIEQPVSTVACLDSSVLLTAIAAGTPRITYQWQKFNGSTFVNIVDQAAGGGPSEDAEGYEGTDSPFLTVTITYGSGTGDFRCKISGELVPDVFSNVATLMYAGSTAIPYVVANSGCGPGQFLISAFGAAEGNYKWYDESGALIDGQVNSTYTTPVISSPTKFSVAQGAGGCVSSPVEVEVNINACAPVPGLVWVAQPKVTAGGSLQIGKMDIDASGNIYAVGYFTGTVDFDSGPGTSILSTAVANVRENFVLKLSSNRDLVWVKSLNSTDFSILPEMSLDGVGNIYVVGGFRGTVDFDPGSGIFSMTSTGNVDMFITKLTTDGNFLWAKRFGGTGTNTVYGRSVASDINGVYTTGNFSGTVDFDPNAGTQSRSSSGSTFFSDIFISKLDPNGDFSWAYRLGRTSATDVGRAIEVDAAGNVYSSGTFSGTVDFDPGAGTANLIGGGATDLYIHKLNNAGIFQWAQTIGGAGVELPYALALDASGNPHLAGTFGTVITNQTVDFDAGAGTFNLVSNQGILFILKLTPAGGFTWAKNFGGTFGVEPNDITVDAVGNVLVIGAGQGLSSYNPDFDPGAGVYLLKSNVNRDIFVTQLDESGNFSWAYNMASTGLSYLNTDGFSIVTDTDGSIYTSGYISHSSDLDPGHCTYPVLAEDGEAFIQKIKPGVASLCFNLQPITASACLETPVGFSVAATGTTNITYQWQKLNTSTSLFEDLTDIGGYSGATSPELMIDTNGNFGTGSYQCKVTGDNAPDKNSSIVTLTVNTPPIPPTGTGAVACSEATQTLTASGSTDANYRWYEEASGGTAIPGEVNSTYITPPINTSTTYFVSIHDGTCESDRTEVIATVIPAPAAPIVTSANICGPGTVSLAASGGSNGQYRWYDVATGGSALAGEVSDSFITPPLATTTSYYVAVHDGICESVRTEAIATINSLPPQPTISASGSTTFCAGGSVTLTSSVANSYLWSTGETTPSITVATSSAVTVVVNNAENCSSIPSAETVIIQNPLPSKPVITASGPTTLCSGSSITLIAPVSTTYAWSTGETTQSIQVATAGSFTVSITDASGCSSVLSDAIVTTLQNCSTNQPPSISTASIATQVGGLVSINLLVLLDDPDGNLDVSTLQIITQPLSGATASIDENGNLQIDYDGIPFTGVDKLIVQVCDLAGSCTQQELTIEVIGEVEIYNAISPNGDGLNDVFIIQYIDEIPETAENKVTIYNRWGDEVFSVSNYNNDTRVFKGLSNSGKDLTSGTYFYKIQFVSGRPEKSGYLSLKR